MQRINDATAATSLPAPPTLPGTIGYFTGGAPGVTAATRVRYWWLNMIQEELLAVITAAGITPDTTATQFTQLLKSLQKLGRIKCFAPLTLYVAASGSDTLNTGLTSGSPFATIQHAKDVLYAVYDLNGYLATISVAAGTYATGAYISGMPMGNNGGILTIAGAGQGATILNAPATAQFAFNCNLGAVVLLTGMTINATNANGVSANAGASVNLRSVTLTASGSGVPWGAEGICTWVAGGGQIGLADANCVFGSASNAHIIASTGGVVSGEGFAYTISGAAPNHLVSEGGEVSLVNSAITVTGTPAFAGAFATVGAVGQAYLQGITFSGAFTGARYSVSQNGVLQSAGGYTSWPGSAGSFSTGGQVS